MKKISLLSIIALILVTTFSNNPNLVTKADFRPDEEVISGSTNPEPNYITVSSPATTMNINLHATDPSTLPYPLELELYLKDLNANYVLIDSWTVDNETDFVSGHDVGYFDTYFTKYETFHVILKNHDGTINLGITSTDSNMFIGNLNAEGGTFLDATDNKITFIYKSKTLNFMDDYEEPTRDGYKFLGWSNNPSSEVPTWDIENDTVFFHTTLYAIWEEEVVVVNDLVVDFNANGGSSVATITDVTQGTTIQKPQDPTKEGFVFKGWFSDDQTFANEWNFSTSTVEANVTLHAKWKAVPVVNEYSVDFNANGGSSVATITGITEGSTIQKPQDPTKEGFVFKGWFSDDQTFANEWNFELDSVDTNVTLHAKWVKENTGELPNTGISDNSYLSLGVLLAATGVVLMALKGKKTDLNQK